MINHREYCLCTPNVKVDNLSVVVKGFLVASMKIDKLSMFTKCKSLENLFITVVVSMKIYILSMYTKCKSCEFINHCEKNFGCLYEDRYTGLYTPNAKVEK